ncbi:protein root UVB sensitive 5 isoform X2 [Cryptomeria japonica]|uniref:protein root UVB sensitive 5 isoform X2 n=1 Tax=Cryptomeria japonica TaxID=3369 RepID=UPI0027DA2CC1|nr:protein root UVB sensitive 5 isoform X2 [Cryptomeria japonica]
MANAIAIPTTCLYILSNKIYSCMSKSTELQKQKPKKSMRVTCCIRETENSSVNERVSRTLVLERYNNETTKSLKASKCKRVGPFMLSPKFLHNMRGQLLSITRGYVLDRNSMVQIEDEVHKEMKSHYKNGVLMAIQNPRLPSIIKEFILPAGYPGSVSDDYLEYMLWQFPTNVTAWICKTLVTSSLLKALGIGSWTGSTAAASTAAALSAAIKWVSKDGLGAIGRLVIGGRFGGLFDDDPKQWRMYADFVGSAGSIFELATPLVPGYFLPLASIGNLTKEEVWEVAGELVGLAIGVTIIATPGLLNTYPKLALTWAILRLLHLVLRYQSLSVLRFSSINLKRARLLVESHVSGSPVPDFTSCNQQENILIFKELLEPRIHFGCPLEMLIGRNIPGNKLEALLDLYKNEKYILTVTTNPFHRQEARVAFKAGATTTTVLRSIWQTYWLCLHGGLFKRKDLPTGSFLSSEDVLMKDSNNLIHCLAESLLKLNETFDDFLFQLENTGWNVKNLSLKVPTKVTIIENDRE